MAKSDKWARDFLSRAPFGYLAHVWDDQPFVYPMTFFYDEKRNCIYLHGSTVGRRKANTQKNNKISFCVAEMGILQPSNRALEFSCQYRGVVVFGNIESVAADEVKKHGLYGLIGKYFDPMKAGEDYRPITDKDLNRTNVYKISITAISGKENWPDKAPMDEEGWPELDEKWFLENAFEMSYGKIAAKKK